MKLKVLMKTNRILIPFKMQETLKNSFLLVSIVKSKKSKKFLCRPQDDGRIAIPKNIRKKLKLKNNQKVEADIKKIRNIKKPKKFLFGKKFDILYYMPEFTLSGYEIISIVSNNLITSWYRAKGRPNEIEIKRYVNLDFARFLGYYQAEGGKLKLYKRRGRELSLTNKSFKIIKDAVVLSKKCFSSSLWNVTIRYNPDMSKKTIKKLEHKLKKLGVKENKIKSKPAKRISTFTIKLWITNSLLAEVLSNFMNELRTYLIMCNLLKKPNLRIFILFMQGLLAGDGNFYSWRDKRGSLHKRLTLFDSNEQFMNDYSLLLKRIKINGRIKKRKGKNLYKYSASLNWQTLLKIRELNLLIRPHHAKILKWTIKEHRNFKKLSGYHQQKLLNIFTL